MIKIVVLRRVYKTFTSFFYTPNTTQPGEVRWADILFAMVSAGCSYREHLGSEVYFSLETKEGFQGSFEFHKPHPSSKVPFRTVRIWGKHLEKKFGWTIDTFEAK